MTLETVGWIVWIAFGLATLFVYAAIGTLVVRDILQQRQERRGAR